MSDQTFYITHWCGVPPAYLQRPDGTPDEHRLLQMKQAGLNLIAPYDHGVPTNRALLSLCHRLGLRVTLSDHRLHAAQADAKQRRALLQAVVNDYADFPALHGYCLVDEPHKNDFPALSDTVAILRELDPAHESYVNLFANYVPSTLLGYDDYEAYLEHFVTEVKPPILSYDHYHFLTGEPLPCVSIPNERERLIFESAYRQEGRPGFFDNLVDARAVADQAGIPFMIVVLLTAHGPCRDLTEAEIRFEVYQSLAYGVSRLSYFTYWTPGEDDIWHWRSGMIDATGRPTHHYDMVARINRELQSIGDTLITQKSLGVFHTSVCPDTKTTPWPGAVGDLATIEADALTVGCFTDGYVLLANQNYQRPQVATLTVRGQKQLLHYQKQSGAWRPLHPVDGCYRIPLDAGDGELLRLL